MSQNNIDDRLLDALSAAFAESDPVPDEVLIGARAAFIARDLDRVIAELVYDSADERELALMRGESVRSLSFEAGDIRIEVDVHQTPAQLVGKVLPAATTVIRLEHEGIVVASTTTDHRGRFRFNDVPFGSFFFNDAAPPEIYTVEFEF